MIIGYSRVSSQDQSNGIQIDALKTAGCEKIFSEKVSGKTTENRKELKKLLKSLSAGDCVVIYKIDRISRNLRDMANILHDLEQRGVAFRSISEDWCRTDTPSGKLLLQLLSCISEYERAIILERTAAGRKKFLENGGRLGRKPKLTPHQQREALERIAMGEGQDTVARTYNCHQTAISYLVKKNGMQRQL